MLRLIALEGWRLTRPMSLVYRSQKYFSPVGERFREFVKAYGAEHLGHGSQAMTISKHERR